LYWGNRKNKDEKVIQGEAMLKYLSLKQVIIFIIGIFLIGLNLFNLAGPQIKLANWILFVLIFLVVKTFAVLCLIEKQYSYPLVKAVGMSVIFFLVFSVIIFFEFLNSYSNSNKSLLVLVLVHFIFIVIRTLIEGSLLYAFFTKISAKKIFIYLFITNLIYPYLFLGLSSKLFK
jgi:hypothetical protein